MIRAPKSSPRIALTPLATTFKAAISKSESISSKIAKLSYNINNCRISLRIFSATEKHQYPNQSQFHLKSQKLVLTLIIVVFHYVSFPHLRSLHLSNVQPFPQAYLISPSFRLIFSRIRERKSYHLLHDAH